MSGENDDFQIGLAVGIAATIIVAVLVIMCAATCHADSTFVPIQPPQKVVCQKVCPVCGGCRPKRLGQFDGYVNYLCGKAKPNWLGDFGRTDFFQIDTVGCDSIIWGRYLKDTIPLIPKYDSVYVLVHDTVICRGNGSYPTVCDTIQVGNYWIKYRTVNGKKVYVK